MNGRGKESRSVVGRNPPYTQPQRNITVETPTEIATVEGWDAPEELDNFERPNFPTDALPGVLADFVRALAVETGTYEDMAGMLTLAAVAAVLAHKVEVRRPWRDP